MKKLGILMAVFTVLFLVLGIGIMSRSRPKAEDTPSRIIVFESKEDVKNDILSNRFLTAEECQSLMKSISELNENECMIRIEGKSMDVSEDYHPVPLFYVVCLMDSDGNLHYQSVEAMTILTENNGVDYQFRGELFHYLESDQILYYSVNGDFIDEDAETSQIHIGIYTISSDENRYKGYIFETERIVLE